MNDEHRRRIDELLKLPHGWDSYNAEPPNEDAATAARNILASVADDMPPPRINATVETGLAIGWRQCDRSATIECYNDGTTAAVVSNRTGLKGIVAWEVLDVDETLRRIKDFLNNVTGNNSHST